MALDPSHNSLLIGYNHIRLKRVNSTNKYANDMVAKSKPIEGTVISASCQYEGRGQIGRFWESEEEKNITCSIILHPSFLAAQDQFQLNITISLAVMDFVDHFIGGDRTKVKWPNDIYVDDKKVAGILIQNTLKGKSIDASVIGTGININQVQFSKDIPNPTSFKLEKGEDFSIDTSMAWLFRFLTKRYLQLKAGQKDEMRKEYLNHLYRINLPSEFSLPDGTILNGSIIGVDQYGKLMIKELNGTVRDFAFREIRFNLGS